MTHVEYLTWLKNSYLKDFEEYPNEEPETVAFRRGMIFAFQIAINGLKNGGENHDGTDFERE